MSQASLISDLQQRKLRIDFLKMSLVQNTSGKEAISYGGPGYIQQTEDNTLSFRLYANETINDNFAANFDRTFKIKPGQLYPEDSYYALNGIAADGTVWKSERILPQCDWHLKITNPVVHGKLSSIMGGELLPNPNSLALHFFEKADLSAFRRAVKFTAAGYDFHVESGDDNFSVEAISDAPLPANFAMRVEEALRFLLAQSITPRAIVQPRAILLKSTTLKSSLIRLEPPISRGPAVFNEKLWALFEAYLAFVIRETKFENWNSCTGYLHMAHEASANSLDAWGIGLAVAVEGLAGLIDIELDKAAKEARKIEKERLRKLQAFIVRQVSSQKRFTAFTERVRGLASGLTSVRAIDRIKWLAEHGGAELTHVDAWRKLRNRGVHPTTKGDIDIASLDYQKILDDLHKVNVLLYHIVFHIIGYHGPYTDYATQNLPTKNYPLTELRGKDEEAQT